MNLGIVYQIYFAALMLAMAQLFVFEAFGVTAAWRDR